MASYTITTTNAQEAAIGLRLQRVNAKRAADGLASWTAQELIEDLVAEPIRRMLHEYRKNELDSVANGFDAATTNVKNQIRTLLGL